jgi:hypothetical protein
MKRTPTLLVAVLLAMAMVAGPASAQSQDWDDVVLQPTHPHPHVLLIGVDFEAFTYERCVDLAGGQALPKANHHNLVHRGTAGAALIGSGKTHVVAPYTCETLPF